MVIERADAKRMLQIWQEPKTTSDFFREHLLTENAEFWMLSEGDRCMGELYFFKNLPQKELADGKKRVYLCAFRVADTHRGKGWGSLLMRHVLERIRSLGFSEATIGAELRETYNVSIYRHFGFCTDIFCSVYDPCDIDADGFPTAGNEIQFMSLRF